MSVQMPLLAPATRVASRKLGPTRGSGSSSRSTVRAACETSTVASTCGRWLTVASRRSCESASSATGRAPNDSRRPWRRSYRTPLERALGVRYQAAPWNRSARACSTPEDSEPAIGWPPTKRSSSTWAAIARFVEPTSVTTVSGPAFASASSTTAGRAPTGAQAKTASAPLTASATEAASRSMAPRSRAAASTSGSVRRPAPGAPPARAAGPPEPPISPTPRTASRCAIRACLARAAASRHGGTCHPAASDAAEFLACQLRRRLDLAQVLAELVGHELLRAVADRAVGIRVRLDDDPVGARGGCGQGQGEHEIAPPGRVARIHHHGQVRELLEHRHGHQVEREAVARLEGPDAALAQHHLLVALLEDVLRRHQEVLERGRQAALQEHRDVRAPHLGQEREVRHVARAELDHVGDLDDCLEIAHVHQLGHDRHAGDFLGLLQEAQALDAETLERVRRGARLVRAAAQELRARVLHRVRRVEQHLARLDRARAGDHHEVRPADLAALDVDYRPLALAELRRGEFVRLRDRRDVVDAGEPVELEVGHVLAVADRADDGHELALGHVRACPDGLNTGYDGVDFLSTCPLFHHDHHLNLDLSKPLVGTLLAVRPWPCRRAADEGVRRRRGLLGRRLRYVRSGRGRTPS